MTHPIVLAVTGASGAAYAVRLLEVLVHADCEVLLTVSESGRQVIRQELGIELDLRRAELKLLLPEDASHGQVRYFHYLDFLAPIASGSHLTAGMVICPCSGTTLSAVAHAANNNLIQRAAEVHLKERRKLIVVPRETPLSLPQIDNMKRVCEAGGIVLPAMPGWYHGVQSVQDLVDFIVARICDQLAIPHNLMRRWGDGVGESEP